MANKDDKKKQTQNDPKNKGKGKGFDKELTSRAGSQSGQHSSSAQGAKNGSGTVSKLLKVVPRNTLTLGSSESKIGELGVGTVNQHTGALAKNQICLSTVNDNTAIVFNGDNESCLSQVADIASQVRKEGQSVSGFLMMTDEKTFFEPGAKRKFLALDDMGDEKLEAAWARKQAKALPTTGQGDQQSSGRGQADNRPKPKGDGQDQGRPYNKRQRRLFCVGCESDKHCLDTCLKAGDNGLMKGCPLCNTLDHQASNCRSGLLKVKKDRVYQFVFKRRNMPSFLNFKSWFELVSANVRPTDRECFPWTPEFTKSNAAHIEQLQNQLDTHGFRVTKLPVDPKLMGWTAVQAHYRSLVGEGKEKALAEARSKVTPLSDEQKAMAWMLRPNTKFPTGLYRDEQVNEDVEMGDNAQAENAPQAEEQSAAAAQVEGESGVTPVLEQEPVAANGESEILAQAKEEQELSHRRPWDEDSEEEDEEVEIEGDDDDDEDGMARRKILQKKAESERIARAKSSASEL
ncbi:uncharacterized protein BKA55DRAFT_567298 [Fusarium redolens]|uniref:Uncharacterized protein n=1 Tax=Fusarium redolens TaxID=48865 RepID=A0A9P9KAN5_FUSRE|nr:uncharacterized protein BKA55DRAFT_567298 [Fusarium redolens]KAH7254263.1 hypothetical protein BKA55DRAFT_567298 [Fusarium redolens]